MDQIPAIDYTQYAKQMRLAFSDPEIRNSDGSLNHVYFNTKKGHYWSQNDGVKLIEGLKKYKLDFTSINQNIFMKGKTTIQLQLRTCILLQVNDVSQVNQELLNSYLKEGKDNKKLNKQQNNNKSKGKSKK